MGESSVPGDQTKISAAAHENVAALYKTLIDTRNLEISLFWQRSNYFLVLNTGIAFGFFKLTDPKYSLIFAVIGIFASALWFCVCLGSKFWQTRWEQRLHDFEREKYGNLNFFSANPKRIRVDVMKGLSFHKLGWLNKCIYRLVLSKPSVSFAMIGLSLLFVLGWLALLVAFCLGTL